MSTAQSPKPQADEAERLRTEWLDRLADLIDKVQTWAEADDWLTRRIEVKMEDSEVGKYKAPGLVMQKDATRLMLEPIGRSTIGAEGIVDLYQMPGLGDVATFFYYDGGWQLHFMSADSPIVDSIREAEHRPLAREPLIAVLEEITK